MFLLAFIFTSLIAHIGFSVIENECLALRFLLFKQGTSRPVSSQVPSAEICRRTSALGPHVVTIRYRALGIARLSTAASFKTS